MANRKTYNTADCKHQLILVETRESKYGGYKQELLVKNLNEIEKEFFICTQCHGLMRNACLMDVMDQSLACEDCLQDEKVSIPMVKSRNNIPGLRAKCPLETRGCVWEGSLGEIDVHLDECEEFIMNCWNTCGVILKRSELANHCENECLNRDAYCMHCGVVMKYREEDAHHTVCPELPLLCQNQCMETFPRKEIDSHIRISCPNTLVKCLNDCELKIKRSNLSIHCRNECQHRIDSCSYCEATMRHRELENHLKVCLEFSLFCPNECLKSLIRKELESHIEKECPNTLIACPYKEMGCQEKIKRYKLQEHEKLFESKHLKITKQIETMKIQNQKLEKENTNLHGEVLSVEMLIMDSERENVKLAGKMEKMEEEIQNKDNEIKQLIAMIVNMGTNNGEKLNRLTSSNTFSPPTRRKSEPAFGAAELFEESLGVSKVDEMDILLTAQFPKKGREHLKIGFLYVCKRGPLLWSGMNKNWNVYLVVLTCKELLFYETAKDYNGKASDTLDMKSCSGMCAYRNDFKSNKPPIPTNCPANSGFVVRAKPPTEYYFVADCLKSAMDWLRLLENLMPER